MQMQAITTGGCGRVVCAESIGRRTFAFVRRDHFFSLILTLHDGTADFACWEVLLCAVVRECCAPLVTLKQDGKYHNTLKSIFNTIVLHPYRQGHVHTANNVNST